MPARASEPVRPTWQIDLDSAEDDPPARTTMKKKMKAVLPVHMPARAPEPGRPTWQIDLDSAEDDEDDPPARTTMKKKMKASGSTSRSARR